MHDSIVRIFVVLLLFVFFPGVGAPLQGAENTENYIYSLKIDGNTINLNPPAVITANRALVPLRFMAENPVLDGQVYWDQKNQKVAIDCRGRYIELFIGQESARVDGLSRRLETAPFIWKDRTYVPLRFLAENLGGVVYWDAAKRGISVDFNYKPLVFAYYYYSPMEEVKSNIGLFTDIAFRWLSADGNGNLHYDYYDQYSQKIQWVQSQGVRAHASVALMDRDELHKLLNNPGNRHTLVQQLAKLVSDYAYDGVNIDFEFIAPADGPAFTEFLQELKSALGPGKILSAAVFARTGKENWAVAYDYAAIGRTADLVVVMAYDYRWLNSEPGPVAPLWWVKEVAAYMQSQMAGQKILLGLPTYGYDWSSDGSAKTVSLSTLKQLKSQYQVVERFDQNSFSPYFTYCDQQGSCHEIWMENERSLNSKVAICLDQKLGGISFWRIGTGFVDLYKVLDQVKSVK